MYTNAFSARDECVYRWRWTQLKRACVTPCIWLVLYFSGVSGMVQGQRYMYMYHSFHRSTSLSSKNRLAEHRVQAFKKFLRKLKLTPSEALQEFLIHYWIAPLLSGYSPSELSNGRRFTQNWMQYAIVLSLDHIWCKVFTLDRFFWLHKMCRSVGGGSFL